MGTETPAVREKTKAKYVAQIDAAELAVRLFEAAMGLKRPAGMTAAQALGTFPEEDRRAWLNAATAAMSYWQECINEMNAVS